MLLIYSKTNDFKTSRYKLLVLEPLLLLPIKKPFKLKGGKDVNFLLVIASVLKRTTQDNQARQKASAFINPSSAPFQTVCSEP